MAFVECSETLCTAAFWAQKYKALRAAFVAWRRIERQEKKLLRKNIQRLQAWSHEYRAGDEAAYWKLRDLLFQMAAEAED